MSNVAQKVNVFRRRQIALSLTALVAAAGVIWGIPDTVLLTMLIGAGGLIWSSRERKAWLLAALLVVLGLFWSSLDSSGSSAWWRGKTFGLYLVGRTGECSLSRSFEIYQERERQWELTRRIRRASKLVEKTEDGLQLWNTSHGAFWVPEGTEFFFLLAEQERRIYGRDEYGVRPGDVVLDCGANVGVFTREALSAGARLVVAIEPVPANVECLRRNFRSEIVAGRVIVYDKGIWHQDGELTMWLYSTTVLDSFVLKERWEQAEPPRPMKLPVTTIDRLVAELRLPKVNFIKMDIEGAERNALEGAQPTLARYRPRLAIATENLPDDQEVVPRLVRKAWAGYRQACGPCTAVGRFAIRPDVLYFF